MFSVGNSSTAKVIVNIVLMTIVDWEWASVMLMLWAPLLIGFVIAASAPNAAQIGSKPVVSKVDARNAIKSTSLQTRSSVQLGKKTKSAATAKYTAAGRTAHLPPTQLTDTAKPVIEKAKASIAAMMVNPASAEFYNLKRAVKKMLDEPVDTICGYVKEKDASGGDTEEMPFLYIIREDRDGEAYLVDGRSYVAKTVHGVLCK
jgi:hypothetical protein